MLCFQSDLTVTQSKTSRTIKRLFEEIPAWLAAILALEMSKATVVCFLKTFPESKIDPPQATMLTLLCIWGSKFWIMLIPKNSWWGFLLHGHLKFSWDCTHGFDFKWLYSFQPATTITLAHTQTPSCCLLCSIPPRDSNPGARRSLPPDDPRAPTFLAFIKAWSIKPSPLCVRRLRLGLLL